ncbi:hypothetical protein [Novosphingobium sp. AP12]|uniref:hypothetical protein n=1 Tax=Novosphingobium sp. AP12 TaxID=1144305 RepID=UPI0012FAAE4E|nr:hypothetical protein [Novosphingobium sp. AP12]
MLKQVLVSLSIFLTGHVPAQACSIPNYDQEREQEQRAQGIANSGVVIDGIVIQGFDARRHKPEIIKAIKVYIGDHNRGTFLISRTKGELGVDEEGVITPPPICGVSGLQQKYWKRGERITQVALIPVTYPTEGPTAFYFDQPLSSPNDVARRAQELAKANGRLRVPLGGTDHSVTR